MSEHLSDSRGLTDLHEAAHIYLRYNDAENEHDLQTAGTLVAPDLAVEINGIAQIASAEEDAKANAELFRTYPDYRRDIVEVVPSGPRAAIRWHMRGTPAPGLTVPPLDVHGCSFVEVQDGRMIRAALYVNGQALSDVLDRAQGS